MENINKEKREKLIKLGFGIFTIFTLGIVTKFKDIKSLLNKKEETKKEYKIEYDEEGYVKSIINNGKVFKFRKGELI